MSAPSDKPTKDVFKCSCTDVPMERDTCSDTESVTSTSFIVVSESPTHTKQKCCLQQRCWSVFNTERFSDVTFIVGKGTRKQRIPAHKVILSIGSDVFNTLFSKNWSLKADEIKVPDVEPAAFKALLRFLYTDDVCITTDNVTAVLYAAKKYAVQSLENLCIGFLANNVCPNNAFTILYQATLYDKQELVNSCLEAIDADTIEAVGADGFTDVDAKRLCSILERNTLTIREIQLFQAVLRWSEAECLRQNLAVNEENQKSVLKQVLPRIRFPLMSLEEFSSQVSRSGLLTNEELLSMYRYFAEKPKPPTSFDVTPRLLSDKELIVNRLKESAPKFTCTGNTCDKINFTCDHGLELMGYGLHGCVSGPGKYEVTLLLIDPFTLVNLRDEKAEFSSDGDSETFRALFKNPIKLTAFKEYTACIYIKGPDCLLGKGGVKEVTQDLPHGQKFKITFSTFVDPDNSNPLTTVEKGLIPQLIFKV